MEVEEKELLKFRNWESLFNAVIDPLIVLDPDGNIITLNEGAAKLLDKSVDELIGLNIYSFMSSNEVKFLKAQLNDITLLRKPVSFEVEFHGKYYDIWSYPIFNSLGKIEQLAVFARDISERKKIEEELRKSDERYRRLLNNLQECIWSASADGKSYFVSKAIENILGFTVEEFLSDPESGWNLIHPDYQEQVAKAYDDLFSKNKLFSMEYPIKNKDGKYIWVHDRAYKAYEKNGDLFADGMLSDITERKKIEEQLIIKSRAIESSNNAMGIADLKGNLIYVNPTFLKEWGYTNINEVIGINSTKFWQIEEKASEVINALQNEGEWRGELVARRKNGQFFIVQLSASVVRDNFGEPICMMTSFINITERKKREEELEKISSELNQIFNIAIPLCVIDTKFNIIRINDTFSIIFNVKSEEIIGKKCYDMITGQLCHTPECTMKQILGGKDHWDYEKEIELSDGTKILCNMRAVPYRDPNGEIISITQNYTDITARKKIEDVLKLSRERYSLATNAAKVGVWDWDFKTGKFYLDPNIKKVLGYSDEEIPNDPKAWMLHVHPDDIKGVMEFNNAHLKGKISEFIYEHRMLHKDGSIRWIQVRGRTIRDSLGKAIRIVGTNTDITTQKEVELKLKISERKLKLLNNELEQKVELRTYELKHSKEKIRNLINNISDVLMECDIDGTITIISPQLYDIIGYHPKELIGSDYASIIHPGEKLAYEKLIALTPKAGSKFSVELNIKHKKGYYIPISLKGSIEEINNELKVFVVIRDITEKRNIETMMKHEIKKLKELDQIRSDLVRRISHELNTPLFSILSGSQYLLDYKSIKIDEDIRKYLKIIHQGGHRLKNLVDNLITAYDIESNELKLELKRENITQIIKDCIENIIFQAKKRDLLINIELLKELYFNVDKSKISLVISGILSNAVRNTPPGGNIFIKTFKHYNYIDIIIKDTGVGFTRKELTILFKKFGKIERSGKGLAIDIEGPGLGLYISQEIVKLHKGEISVKSKGRNKGSTFCIRLYTS